MKQLCLESNDDSTILYISGDIGDIFSNRRAARYIKDTLKFTQTDTKLTVEVDKDINKTIDKIKKICEYISAELVYSGKV